MKKLFSMFNGVLVLSLFFSFVICSDIKAEIPKTINVQGKLTTDSGQPITGDKVVSLKIYDVASGGTALYTKDKTVSVDEKGLYSANIEVENISFDKQYYFEVVANGVTSKRTPFASNPSAFYASTSTYTLKLDPNGEKLVNENFDTSITYTINVDTANYAVNASSIASVGTSGYVWGLDGTEQKWISPGSLSIPIASKNGIGGIKLADNTGLSNDISSDGVLRVSTASATVFGGVKIGDNINVNNGVISVSTADKNTFGVVKVGNNINVINGVISVNPSTLVIPVATTSSTGTVKIGDNISINDSGVISVSTADENVFGVAKVKKENGLTISNGEISLQNATDSALGTMKLYNVLGTKTDGTITQNAIKTALDNKLEKNADITGATHTKITYDAKGLVTSGADLESSDIITALGFTPYDSVNPNGYITKDSDDLTNYTKTSDLASVATSGSYNDLIDKPTIPTITDTYSSTSSEGMSGKAVANAISTLTNYAAGNGISITGSTTKTIKIDCDSNDFEFSGNKLKLKISGGDLAEIYQSTEKLVPGDVVSIDVTKDNAIVKTKVAEDTLVAGVIATEPGILMNQKEKGYKLALVGKVPTKVCNEGGNIKRGDLLVSASVAGYAKKAGDNPKTGTVIGKALENFDSQKGTILVLVNLQ